MLKRINNRLALLAEGWRKLSTWRILISAFEAIFAFFGVAWLAIEVETYFAPDTQDFLRPYGYCLLVGGIACCAIRLIVLVWQNSPKRSARFRVDKTNTVLEIVVGDLFDTPGSLIIPTSITFDTSTDDKLISPESIQGQFTKNAYPSTEHLDHDVQSELEKRTPERTAALEEKPFGKRKEYPVGTCVRIANGGHVAYFLALTRYNSDKTSGFSISDLQTALEQLWKQIRTSGEFEELKTPILGSGKSRINATREDLAKAIVRSFTSAVIDGPFCKTLRVVIHPADLEHAHLDFDEIVRFAESHARYR